MHGRIALAFIIGTLALIATQVDTAAAQRLTPRQRALRSLIHMDGAIAGWQRIHGAVLPKADWFAELGRARFIDRAIARERDPWGTPFAYVPGDTPRGPFLLWSAGPDRRLNTMDDIDRLR